jgi:FeS assembly SUF system protein
MFRAILKRANLETEAGLALETDPLSQETTELLNGEDQPTNSLDTDDIHDNIVGVLKTIHDPEIPVNIYDLGLIYGIAVNDERDVHIRMTLTSPNCPEAQSLPASVQRGAESVQGVRSAQVDIVWDPPWDMSKMTEAARLKLNMF